MVLFLGVGPPFVNPGVCPPGQHLDSHLGGGIVTVVSVHPAWRYLPSWGRARWVGGRRWRLSRRRQSPKREFLFPFNLFLGIKTVPFYQGVAFYSWILLDMLVAKRERTPWLPWCIFGGYPSVGIFGEKSGQKHCKTTVSPLFGCHFLLS